MLYGCGLRLGELLSLNTQATRSQLGWVDLQANDVHVWGKGQRKRVVPLGSAAATALKLWLNARTAWAKPAPPIHARHTPEQLEDMALFINPQGQRLSPQHTRRIVKQWALTAGISTHVHPHMLRHSFASHLLQSSGDIRAVQDLLGHANISTTQVYTRLDFQHLATAYDAAHPRARRLTPDK
jgi:integrase/recombinase XerC